MQIFHMLIIAAFTLVIVGCLLAIQLQIGTNQAAEKRISKMLNKQIPYDVEILDCSFIIGNVNCYPPGKLSALFSSYLIENNLINNKTIVDAGAGCFALGIIAAKHGAKQVIGIDILDDVVDCARANIENNQVKKNASIVKGDGLEVLFPDYVHKVDLLLCGAPWHSLSYRDYRKLPDERKPLSRAFYDIDDHLIKDILQRSALLLSSNGRVFITSAQSVIQRHKKLFLKYNIRYDIVKQEDIHNDGNIHYIIELHF